MARLKAMVRSALEDRSPRFLLTTVALGVVVALVAGLAIGYTVDDGNGGSGGRRTATQKKNNKKKAPRLTAAPLLIGDVASFAGRKLVARDASGKQRSMRLGGKTRIYATADAKPTDVKVGSHVLFAPTAAGTTTATEVIVLPDQAKLGQEVAAVVAGTSMSVKTLAGSERIQTDNAVFLKTSVGRRTDLVKDTKVVVQYFVVRGRRNQATAVVVLPKDTKFN
jgi:co-chaperonin GroES (HSP10)